MQTTIIRAVGVQTHKHGRRPRAYNLFRAVVLHASEYAPGKMKWIIASAPCVWRYNYNDAWGDALLYARQNDMDITRTAKAGDRVVI